MVTLYHPTLTLLLCFSLRLSLAAQINEIYVPEHISSEWQEELLSLVGQRLKQPGVDTLSNFFTAQITDHCREDQACLRDSYWVVVDELNSRKEYFAAIPLTEELARMTKQQEDFEGEVLAIRMLHRLYVFMDDQEVTFQLKLRLLALYEAQGDVANVIYTKRMIAEAKAYQLGEAAQAIAEHKELLAQSRALKLERNINNILMRLKLLYEDFGYPEELPAIVEQLEQIPLSDPIQHTEYEYAYHAWGGRADLYLRERNYDQAAKLYQKVIDLTKTRFDGKGDLWREIDMLHRLARLEWARGNKSKANEYLAAAMSEARAYKLNDHILDNLQLRIDMAEEDQRFAEALDYTRQRYALQGRVDSISADFDVKRHFTQLANERLEGEKTSQALKLRAKNNQLISLLLAVALILLVVAGLWLGYRRLQKAKQVLSEQNLLIQKQAEQLRNQDAARTRFFANVSHELRTPLSLITGPVNSLLKKGQFAPEEHQLLTIIQRNGHQLQQLINRILDLQKMEAGKMDIHTQPTSLATFFGTHLGQFESLATSQEIDYKIDVRIAKEAVAELDQQKCRELLNNLLSNAFKFTPRSGRIRAAVSLKGEELHLEVSDSGPGIHPDDLPHVFDPYFQTTRPEKPLEGGTGLGLALCQEYAQLFGGRIAVRNNPEKGASFSLSFPLTLTEQLPAASTEAVHATDAVFQPVQPAATERRVATQGNAQERPTLLVVEDNAELRDYLSLILRDQYQLVLAADGQEALDYLLPDADSAAAPCQLILSDLMMPRVDGYQLVERLKSTDATRHLPIIMLTARADARDKLKALRLGVDDYLLKPFDEAELKVRINNLLRNQAIRLATIAEEPPPGPAAAAQPLLSATEQEWLTRFETYVQDNLSSDILSVSLLAQEFAMSESTLHRQLKGLIGLSPGQYLKEARLDQARQFLENRTYQSVEQVANAVGYGDYRSFSRSFKQRYGKLPSGV